MIVVDANLLLYAYSRSAAEHRAAKAWLARILSELEPVGLPWQSVAAFLRILTNSNLPGSGVTMPAALAVVEEWMALPQVRILAPTERHWAVLRQALLEGQARGPLVSDAELAALAMEYGGVLHTTDRDFSRFPGLRWINPLTRDS
jgi:uncharacterized protein